MDSTKRIELASKLIPQLDAAVRMGMDKQVLDRMLHEALEACELSGHANMPLHQGFDQLERVHGGFRDFYTTVQDTMRKERVQAGVLHIQAIVADVEDAAAIHYMPNLRQLCNAEPNVAARMQDLAGAVKALRDDVKQCKSLGKDLTSAIAKIEDSAYVAEADTQSYVRKSSMKMA